MNRSLSIAVGTSVGLHCALLLGLLMLRVPLPAEADRQVISVYLAQLNASAPAAETQAAAPSLPAPQESNAAVSAETAAAQAASAAVAPVSEPVEDALPPTEPEREPATDIEEAAVLDTEPAVLEGAAALESTRDAAVPQALAAAPTTREASDLFVTTTAPGAEERVPERVSMSPAEQKMLRKKVREWTENFQNVTPEEPVSWQYGGQTYSATFEVHAPSDSMDIERVFVEINTGDSGNRLSARVAMKRLVFSSFAQFVDRWDPGVRLHDDEVDGRFHSNSALLLASSRDARPRFTGKVTATKGYDTDNTQGMLRRDDVFLGGFESGVKRIPLPKAAVSSEDVMASSGNIRHFDEDARIVFYADGSYGWNGLESQAPEQRSAVGDAELYLLAGERVELHVKGVVNGRVLVYSPERIVIDGNLTYSEAPELVPESDDYLGLVSDKYIEVATGDVTGPGDLTIDASIYAKRRFAVRGFGRREKATLEIYGSLTAGSLSATEPRYRTRVEFDGRLDSARAPGFPMTDRYEMESADFEWDAAPGLAFQ